MFSNAGFNFKYMCGIVGYVGFREAQPVLLNCLSKLEYRGYDSCGIAISGSSLEQFKDAIRVGALKKNSPLLKGTIGIGHTRWATHGPATAINAHPHLDCSRRIAVVHNGIISNYEELRRQLIDEGHVFLSETDTEVIPHLIEKCYQGDPLGAVETALEQVEGSFAIGVLVDGYDKLIVSRKESPLVIGIGDNERIIASDVTAMLDYTNRVEYLEDGDIALVSNDDVKVRRKRVAVERAIQQVNWDRAEVEKNGYDHFLIKEIHEQPRVIRDSLRGYFGDRGLKGLVDSGLESVMILGCGTSYHAGLVGKQIFEDLLGIPVTTEIGSEFIHRDRIIPPSVAIALTQSGETADVLLSVKKLKQMHVNVLAITNVQGSTISRLADHVIYTSAGPEMSVAATKSYTAQLIELYKLALSSDLISSPVSEKLMTELRRLPVAVEQVLDNEREIANYANILSKY